MHSHATRCPEPGLRGRSGRSHDCKKGCTTLELDIKDLQKQLVAVGNLPESVLKETDNFPLPKERVAQAVRSVANDHDGLEVVLAQFDIAQPLLREGPYPMHRPRTG